MTRVLVAGVTGRQGGAVADLLLTRGHAVTGLVRSSESRGVAELLARGAEVVVGDLSDGEALVRAVEKADAVFGLSVPFGNGGQEQEIQQGRLLVDAAAATGAHLVYSSVRGADRLSDSRVAHAGSKQIIEQHLQRRPVAATVLGPTYFMENLLNVRFTGLASGRLSLPLSPDKKIDQVTVLDIAGMAVHAIENPTSMIGKRVDLASDSVTGSEMASALSEVLGAEIPYAPMPIEQVRQRAGAELAAMFERFETNTDFVDITALREDYPAVRWHDFTSWARTVDWPRILRS